MPPLSFLAVEAVAFGFAAALIYEAYKLGAAKLTTLLVAMAFGFAIELFFVTQYSGYSYGDFLVDFPLSGHTVPLWVAAGWGSIIFISMQATERMGLPWYFAAPADGLLAVSLDVTLDPVAEALGWWHWSRPGQFFGVPYDNFIGWIMIVGFYSFFARAGLELTKKHGLWKDIVMPIVALIPAVLAVAGCQLLLEKIYPLVGEPHTFFALLVLLTAVVYVPIRKAKATGAPSWYLRWVPFSYHLLMLVLLVVAGISTTHPELVLYFPVAIYTSLTLFTYPEA